jgi:acetyl esterase/lipase
MRSTVRALVGLLLALAVTGLPAPAPAAPTLDPASKTYAVGLRRDVLLDPTRATPEVAAIGVPASPERRIPVTVFYPARGAASSSETTDARPARGRFPLIVWAHGNGSSGSATPHQVRSWATRGYVVVAPDFPVSTHARSNLDAVADWPNQPGDVSFVLDQSLDADGVAGLGGRIDTRHVGVAGHSLGAITALADAYGAHKDPRLDAVVSFSGVPVVDDTDVARTPTPLLLLHGDDDRTIPVDASRAMFARGAGPRALVVVAGGGHSPYLYAPDPELEQSLLTATTRFWDATLRTGSDPTEGLAATAIPDRTTVEVAPAASPTTTATKAAKKTVCPTDGTPVRDVRYRKAKGADPKLVSVDVYPVATGCPAPVVVWVHGGGWRVGDKRFQMADKVAHWNGLGYTVVSVNYRLTDPAAAEPVRYPTHNEDVATAVAWVHDNIADYGGDPDRIALLGHSAGAQIVASVATDPTYLDAHDLAPSDLRCVAPLDTEGFDVARTAGSGNPIYVEAFGSEPATWTEASPLTHVRAGADIPPHLLVRRGTPGRQRIMQQYADALTAAGVPVTVIDGAGLTHNDVNRLIGAPGDTRMTPGVDAFLAKCLAPAGSGSTSTTTRARRV